MQGATPLLRQWYLLVALSARGVAVRELAEEHGVTQRTIRRDLDTLRQAGFPLEETRAEHGRKLWKLASGVSHPAMALCWDEAAALFLARQHLEPLAGTPLWDAAQRAFRKIRATLGDGAIRYLEKIADKFHRTTVGRGDYAKKGEAIDQLMLAIEDRRITFLTYHSSSSTEPVTYEIYPYGIVFHRHSLYLVARSVSHNEIRHFKIDRVESVELDPLKFQPPDDFDLQQHLADSFGIYQGDPGQTHHVRIRFTPQVARYVKESHWHPTQQLTNQPDGGLLFEVTLGSLEEIQSWTLSFGRHAEVLEPTELRDRVAVELREACGQYVRSLSDGGRRK